MAFDPTPWVVAGGAQHSADLARTLAFAATSGAQGIVLPDSLKVSAYGTPGAGVNIGPGSAIILNRNLPAPTHGEQSYVARAGSTTSLAVPATSGTSRSDMVVVRIDDPQYPGTAAPSNPATATYVRPFLVQGVAPTATTAKELNLGFPAVALARIDLPANTTNITSTMVKDVRKVALPRRERLLLTHYPGEKNGIIKSSPPVPGSSFVDWPYGSWFIDVPEWATVAAMVGTIAGCKVGHPDPAVNGDINTQTAVRLGSNTVNAQTEAAQTEWLTVVSPNTGQRGYMRGDITAGGTVAIPTALRGTNVNIRFMSAVIAGLGEIYVDRYSTLIMDVEFQERPI